LKPLPNQRRGFHLLTRINAGKKRVKEGSYRQLIEVCLDSTGIWGNSSGIWSDSTRRGGNSGGIWSNSSGIWDDSSRRWGNSSGF